MNTSPITTWEGAEAYFTYADSPMMIGFWLILAIALTVFPIISMIKHETESSKKL